MIWWIGISGVGMLATVAALYSSGLDMQAAVWATRLQEEYKELFRIFSELGDSQYTLIPSGILLIVGYLLKAPKHLLRAVLLLFSSIALSGILANVFKFFIGRPRPRLALEGHIDFVPLTTNWLYHSLPSGHTTTAAAIAVVLALWWRPLGILGGAVILAVGSSRIILGAHYPGDVVAGIWLGAIVPCLLWKYFFLQASCLPKKT